MHPLAHCFAIALVVGGSACGRLGYEGQPGSDSGAIDDKLADAALTDAREGGSDSQAMPLDGGGGGALQCNGQSIAGCSLVTIVLGIAGSTALNDSLEGYASPLPPACGSGPVSEVRYRIGAPEVAAVVSFEVESSVDIMLSILPDDCEAASLNCTTVTANSNGIVELSTQPDEAYILSAASNACGPVRITIRAMPADS